MFHAGDGNLHPLICYDEAIPGQASTAEDGRAEILKYCIEAGGSITGEHGVGADKKAYMAKMFSEADLDTMQRVRCAFDPAASATRARSFRRRGCAAKCLVPTGSTRSSARGR